MSKTYSLRNETGLLVARFEGPLANRLFSNVNHNDGHWGPYRVKNKPETTAFFFDQDWTMHTPAGLKLYIWAGYALVPENT